MLTRLALLAEGSCRAAIAQGSAAAFVSGGTFVTYICPVSLNRRCVLVLGDTSCWNI